MKKDIDLYEKSNFPIIPQKYIEQEHKIFIKYTTNENYIYSLETLKILCNNSKSKNKISLFHKSMKCLLKVLFNLYNSEYIKDFDLLILACFYLGLKLNEIRTKIPKLKKLKEIYPEKYNNYSANSIKQAEVICIRVLDYNIDILTSYDCLVNLLCDNNALLQTAVKELEKLIKNNLFDFISRPPIEIALRCISKANRLKYFYIHPSLLIKEYNNNKNERNNNLKIDENNINQTVSTFSKIKHSNIFSSEKIITASNKITNEKSSNNARIQKNSLISIYSCSFKVLKRLSNVTKSNYSNLNTFSDIKNSMNLNMKKSVIGKKLYENNLKTTKKNSNLLFRSAFFSNTNNGKEEKENYFNSNLIFNRNKDIKCVEKYNKAIRVGKKKLFDE